MLISRLPEALMMVRDGKMRLGAARTVDLNMMGSSTLTTVIRELARFYKRKVA